MLFKPVFLVLFLNMNFFSLPLKAPPIENQNLLFDCTLNAQYIILTEAGFVKIAFSITAEDCTTAQRGIWEAAKGFLKGW